MEPSAHLRYLETASREVAEVAEGRLGEPVGACPGWTVADLVGHLGGVYSWARAVLAARGERPTTARAVRPDDPDAVIAWFLDQRSLLLSDLARSDAGAPAWAFTTSAATVAWWFRRQALETAVHLYDARTAAGSPEPVDADIAADGIDELLGEFLPVRLRREPVEGLHGTLHIHSTDAPGEWMIDFAADDLALRRDHGKADTAVRGPASGLYLWLWNRVDPDEAGLQVFGEPSIVAAWKDVRL